MSSKNKSHLFRNLMAVVAIFAGFLSVAVWLVNRPETLRHALAVANVGSEWKMEVASFLWRPLKSEIRIKGIVLAKEPANQAIKVGGLKFSYRLPGLLRGKLVIGKLDVEGVSVEMPPTSGPSGKKEHKRINLARLILLKNMDIEKGSVRDLSMTFGKNMFVSSDEVKFKIGSTFFGKTELSIVAAKSVLSRPDRNILTADSIGLSASTDLNKWDADFPYLNSADGKLNIEGMIIEGVAAERLAAEVSLFDHRLKLDGLDLTVEGKSLKGALSADTSEESFALLVDIPKPITLPYIGRPTETINTAGALSGKIELKGNGFIPSETNGSGRLELTHRFDASPDAPLSVSSKVFWTKGAFTFEGAKVRAGTDEAQAFGTVDIAKKMFKLSASGNGFPLEHVFDKFTNPQLKKIFGPTDFNGAFEGWGKKFTAKVKGVTHGGGWLPVIAERAETALEATYDVLKLKGEIFADSRQTGSADLTINFGAKDADGVRSKKIDLSARIDGHPLEQSVAAWGLKGIGSGEIKLSGPQTSFKGEARISVDGGHWCAIPFDKAAATLGITRREVVFSGMSIGLSKMASPAITGNLTGDIKEESFRLHGTPAEGLSIDATYNYAGSKWNIADISWNDPNSPGDALKAKGSFASLGGMDIKVAGRTAIKPLAFLAPFFRNAEGKIDVDAALRGTSSDPKIFGTIGLDNNTVSPRAMAVTLEDLNGKIGFNGSNINFEGVTGKIDDGEFSISGHMEHRAFKLASVNTAIKGYGMRYRSPDGLLRLEFDGELGFTGSFPHPLLKGDVTILDGRYSKDFTIMDAFSGKGPKERKSQSGTSIDFDPQLALHVRNSGDLAIRNNVGDIWLNVNVDVKGTRADPVVAGSIDTTDGKVHYLGLDFDISKGFMEFRQRYGVPFLEVCAQKEVGVYSVNLVLRGPTNNLALDLSATSPSGILDKKDAISLIMFGVTDQERNAALQAGSQVTGSIVGQAVSGVIGQPVMKLTHLDVFRVEAGEAGKSGVSRVVMGKQLNDRLSLNFATDINTANAVQTFIGEYLITDNLLLKGERASDSSFKFTGMLRFRLR